MLTTPKSVVTCLPLVAALVLAACSEPTRPTPPVQPQSLEVYSGPIEPGGTNTYLFSLQSQTTVQLMLAGVVAANPLRSISPVMRLELAEWSGTDGCKVVAQADVEPRLTSQMQRFLNPGTYCAQVTDIGGLSEPAAVTIRVAAPAIVSLPGEPGTRLFGSTLTPRGSAATTFIATNQGRVTVTLDAVSENAEVIVALGVADLTAKTCRYSVLTRTRPGGGPHIDAVVDAGEYCAAIVDDGALSEQGTFQLTITYP